MNASFWRALALLATVQACTLIEPLDSVKPNSTGGDTGSAGDGDTTNGGSATATQGGDGANAGTDSVTPGAAGAAGEPAAGGSGGNGTPPTGGTGGCAQPGGQCAAASDCCQTGSSIPTTYGASCIMSDSLCHADCTSNSQCASKCCAAVDFTTAFGVCADPAVCKGS